MFDFDTARWIVIGTVISLLFMGLRFWLPQAAARRLEERGSIVGPALKPGAPDATGTRSAIDMQYAANRQLHDDMLKEALRLKVMARSGRLEERVHALDRAVGKVEDAKVARPDSYEATKLMAELHLDRGLLMEGEPAVAPLEQAAQLFMAAAGYRRGIIDNYVGRGWSYLVMTAKDPDWAATYAVKAAAGFAAGFARVPQNLWVMRGWGLAVDRYARAPRADPSQLATLESEYRAALAQHRGGRHELFTWYSDLRAATEPQWIDVPPLRDVY